MSRVPMGTASSGADTFGPSLAARYPEGLVKQGVAAELVAARWKLDRDALDAYAVASHQRAAAALDAGFFANEVVAMPVVDPDGGNAVHAVDETVRPGTTVEALKPSFFSVEAAARFPAIDWRITPGNSSPLTDGASATLIMSEQMALSCGLRPRARFHAFAVSGDDPLYMLTAPIPATQQVLHRGRLTLERQPIVPLMVEVTPVKRPEQPLPGRPQDIAATVAFLESDAAAFISGCDIRVDGGLVGAGKHMLGVG